MPKRSSSYSTVSSGATGSFFGSAKTWRLAEVVVRCVAFEQAGQQSIGIRQPLSLRIDGIGVGRFVEQCDDRIELTRARLWARPVQRRHGAWEAGGAGGGEVRATANEGGADSPEPVAVQLLLGGERPELRRAGAAWLRVRNATLKANEQRQQRHSCMATAPASVPRRSFDLRRHNP